MPKLVIPVNPEAKSAFENYEGPTPPVGTYEGVIKNVRVKVGKDSGNPYLNVLVEHKASKPEHKKYDTAPQWIRVMFGDHNETEARLAAFVKAVTGKANKEANIVDTDEEARKGTGSIVKTIDGVKPDGKPCKFDIREEAAQNGYEARLTGDFIRRIIAVPTAAEDEAADAVGEDDIEVEEDDVDAEATEEDEDTQTKEEREADLKKESLADLKAAAIAAEIDIKGLKKADLVAAILEWEFEDVDGEEEAEEEEELEVDEEEEAEEGEEEAEEEEDDVDPEAEIRAELAPLDRTALKVRLKEADADAKVLKKDTDDDLRTKIVNAELGEPPF